MAIFIEIKAADGTESRTRIAPGANRFAVRSGDSYRFVDEATGLSPPNAAVKRLDNSLIVTGLAQAGDAQGTQVELVEFYSLCSVGSPCQVELNPAPSVAPVIVTSSTEPIGALADGSFVLYDPGFTAKGVVSGSGPTTAASGGSGDGIETSTILYGVGGLALVGLALSGGGGGGGTTTAVSANPAPAPVAAAPSPTPTAPAAPVSNDTPPAAAQIAAVTGDNLITLNEKAAGVTVAGTGAAGASVAVSVGSVAKSTVVDAGGQWAVTLNAAELGGDGQHVVSVVLTNAAGMASPVATQAYRVDTASKINQTIATDNVVNATERSGGVVIAGTGPTGTPVGTTIDVTIAGSGAPLQYTATTTSAGTWSTTVFSTDALSEGSHTVTAAARIGATTGTAGTASFSVDSVPPAAPIINLVAGDNAVTPSERAGFSVSGLAEAGSVVEVTIGATKLTVTADPTTGAWVTPATFTTSLISGVDVAQARATDKAGNASGPASKLFIIDRAVASDGSDLLPVNKALASDPTDTTVVFSEGDITGSQPLGTLESVNLSVDLLTTKAVDQPAPAVLVVTGSSSSMLIGLIEDPLHSGFA